MNAEVGPPLVVADAGGLARLVERLLQADRYALDTEFLRERSYWPKVALLQVAWPASEAGPAGVALVDPLATDVAPLASVLAGPATMVAHAADQDLEVLERACGRGPNHLWDTQVAAGFAGRGSSSLSALLESFLGVHVAKADRLTDWSRRPLTPSQIAYAASDVAHLLDLADAIGERLARSGRRAWAEEECDAVLARARTGILPERAWWRLRDARQLRGTARGVAQEVAAWRERRAQTLDQPVRAVLPDLALQAIAHHPPKSQEALAHVRGLDGRRLRNDVARGLLTAIETGKSLPSDQVEVPRAEDVPKELRPAVSLIMAWVGQLARDEGIEAVLLATRGDVAAYLRGDPDARLAQGWRADMLAEPMRALVEGRAVIAFDGAARLVLEERHRSQPTT